MDFKSFWQQQARASILHSLSWIALTLMVLCLASTSRASDDVMWTLVVTAMLGYSALSAVGGWVAPSWRRHSLYGAIGYLLLTGSAGLLCGTLCERGFSDVAENRGVYDGLFFSYFMITGVGGLVRMIAAFLNLEGESSS